MVRVVDGSAVEEHQVLVCRTAADIEAAGSLADRLDARQSHHHLEGIGLTERDRHVLYHLDAYFLDTHPGSAVLGHALRGDHCTGEREYLLLHNHVKAAVAIDHQVEFQVFQGIAAESQFVLPDRKRNPVETVFVGRSVTLAALVIDRDADQGLSRGNVPDITADCCLAAPAPRIRIAYLVYLVLECHLGGIAPEIVLQGIVFRCFRFPPLEIAGRQGKCDITPRKDEILSVIMGDGVTAVAQLGDGTLKELLLWHPDSIAALVGIVRHEIDLRSDFGPYEFYE